MLQEIMGVLILYTTCGCAQSEEDDLDTDMQKLLSKQKELQYIF